MPDSKNQEKIIQKSTKIARKSRKRIRGTPYQMKRIRNNTAFMDPVGIQDTFGQT